jgi:hypothetical protein
MGDDQLDLAVRGAPEPALGVERPAVVAGPGALGVEQVRLAGVGELQLLEVAEKLGIICPICRTATNGLRDGFESSRGGLFPRPVG